MAEKNCGEVHRIWIDEAAGHAISELERELVADHLERCASCRVEALAIDVLADGRDADLAAALDELSERRLISQVLSQVDQPGEGLSTQSTATARRQRRTVVAAAAIAAIVTFGISAGAFLLFGDLTSESPAEQVAIELTPPELGGGINMTSGDVRRNGETTTSGAVLTVGERIVTDNGRAALGIESGVALLLEAQTAVEVKRLDRERISVFLHRGRIVAQVDPHRSGPPVRVETAAGDVEVTGTAFVVEAREQRVAVQVLRGSVKLAERERRGRMLRLGEAVTLGQDEITTLTSAEIKSAEQVLGTLELISDEQQRAQVEIKSWPAGATVAVDGRTLGKTPLAVAVRPGHRRLELSIQGHESVREHLALGRGAQVTRSFELRPIAGEPETASPTDGQLDARISVARSGAAVPETDAPDGLPPTAQELLEQALALRAAKKWGQAAAAYEELIMSYPGSDKARAALVSLGRIQLEHLGRPGNALRTFDSYLTVMANGSLAQEAAFGRATAFRRLGRRDQEEAALRDFLGRFPAAIQADRARARLSELARLPR